MNTYFIVWYDADDFELEIERYAEAKYDTVFEYAMDKAEGNADLFDIYLGTQVRP